MIDAEAEAVLVGAVDRIHVVRDVVPVPTLVLPPAPDGAGERRALNAFAAVVIEIVRREQRRRVRRRPHRSLPRAPADTIVNALLPVVRFVPQPSPRLP